MLFTPTLPPIPYLTGRCQRFNIIGRHSLRERISGRIGQGLGIKSGLPCLIHPASSAPPRDPLGVSSQFAEGAWVRVRDQAKVRETLDGQSRMRGLEFAAAQWATCSKVYRVMRSVRRIIDDQGNLRPISHTVLLSGIDCTIGGTGGCGRHCPVMYRDEWLDSAEPPPQEEVVPPAEARFARIRSLQEITHRLDWFGQRQGLLFIPEMAGYAGSRARILRQLSRVFEYDRWRELRHPVTILEGLHCTGGILGSQGPCDRACMLLWHADWLDLDA